jgi:soluble lytic murein transglycosylase-like protein
MITTPCIVKADLNCNRHPIYCQIKGNNPTLNSRYAFKLSNLIYKVSKRYDVPARIYTAILMQESAYKLSVKNCTRGLNDKWEADRVCNDFGISQINYLTARSYGMDIEKLTTDLHYSVRAGAKVLSWFKVRYQGKEPGRWYCRYNTGTASPRKIKKNCDKYLKLVSRYL